MRSARIVLLACLAFACAKGARAPACAAADSNRCACPGGGEGLQACLPSGEAFGACVCSDACAQGAACVAAPALVGKDLDAAGALVAQAHLLLPDPVDPKGYVTVQRVADPPVQILAQVPAAGTPVKPGTRMVLTVTLPPDQETLGLPNANYLVGKLTRDTEASAQAYYDALDPGPFPTRSTFADWKAANGFGTPADAEASAIYVTHTDLGFGRHMHLRKQGRRVAFYVENYPTLEDTIAGTNFVATVAMEWSPGPQGKDTDPYFTQFYAFNKKGVRFAAPLLDDHGPKQQPAVCLTCHGGTTNDPTYASNGGNLGAHFIPFDLDAEQFSDRPGYTRKDQEAAFKIFNEAVRSTWTDEIVAYPAGDPPPALELIDGWYGGAGHPSPVFLGAATPQAWNVSPEARALYHDVFARSCQTCHAQREPARNFSTYAKFAGAKALIQERVFDEGAMPLSQRGALNFWLSSPQQPRLLATWLGIELHAPGRPLAQLQVLHGGAAITAGMTVMLDGSGSQFAGTYAFRQTGGTAVALFPASADGSKVQLIAPASAATLTFELVVSLNGQNSAPALASFATQGAPGSAINVVATPGVKSATVSWTLPGIDGNSSLLHSTVIASPGGITAETTGSSTQALVTGLLAGLQYSFTVVATNGVGDGPASAPSAPVTIFDVPARVQGLVATPGNAAATLSWPQPADGGTPITAYQVTATPSGAGAVVQVAAASSPATVGPLVNGLAYAFTVIATNNAGSSAASAPSNAVTPAGQPGAPTGVLAIGGNGKVGLSWTSPANTGGVPLTRFLITGTPAPAAPQQAGGGATSATVAGLVNGTTYVFTVVADNGVSTSNGAMSNAVTPATVPSAPASASASPGNASATVAWTAPASNGGSVVTSYVITSSPASSTVTVGGGATNAVVSGLVNNTLYVFSVSAANAAGTGPGASTAPVQPSATPGVPSAPLAVSAAAAGSQTAGVSWSPPSVAGNSAITSYLVTATPTSAGSTVQQTFAAGAGQPAPMAGLTGGLSYTFTVAASNGQGTGPASSSTAAVAIVGPPQAPGSAANTRGNGFIDLSWTAPSNTGGSALTGSTVSWSPATAGSPQSTAAATTSLQVTGLAPGTSYTFSITASNAHGASAAAMTSAVFAVAPGAPTLSTLTAGSGTLTPAWAAPANDGGAGITSYTVTAVPSAGGNLSASTSGLTTTLNGLQTCTSYAVTVTATNAVGTSAASNALSAVDATVPAQMAAPTVGNLASGNAGEIPLTWSVPATGGCPILDYALSSAGPSNLDTAGIAGTGRTFSGLTTCAYNQATRSQTCSSRSWTFSVSARNAIGYGAFSSLTSAIRPLVSYVGDGVSAIFTTPTIACTGCHTQGSNKLVLGGAAVTSFNSIMSNSPPVIRSPVASSYLLLCPTGNAGCQPPPYANHPGGTKFTTADTEYAVLSQWIADGAKF